MARASILARVRARRSRPTGLCWGAWPWVGECAAAVRRRAVASSSLAAQKLAAGGAACNRMRLRPRDDGSAIDSCMVTDVAALHTEPPDVRDEDALLDALRVVLHEQPDIHEKVRCSRP